MIARPTDRRGRRVGQALRDLEQPLEERVLVLDRLVLPDDDEAIVRVYIWIWIG